MAHRPLHRPQIQGKARIATRGARHASTAQAPIPRISVSSDVCKRLDAPMPWGPGTDR